MDYRTDKSGKFRIGMRAIIYFNVWRPRSARPSLHEIEVIDISPSSEYIKLKFLDGDVEWVQWDEIVLVEELPRKVRG